jgi:predicted mannosyl-3-phosphoglycerate phosphatase (HAD superfamily)
MDKRKNNGGNSTKSKGIDKRKNQYKEILEDALSPSELIDLLVMLQDKAIKDKDIQAAKILLEYYIGKPQQRVDVTSGGDNINIPIVKFFDTKQ